MSCVWENGPPVVSVVGRRILNVVSTDVVGECHIEPGGEWDVNVLGSAGVCDLSLDVDGVPFDVVHGETAVGAPVEKSDDGLLGLGVFAVALVFGPVDVETVLVGAKVDRGALRATLAGPGHANVVALGEGLGHFGVGNALDLVAAEDGGSCAVLARLLFGIFHALVAVRVGSCFLHEHVALPRGDGVHAHESGSQREIFHLNC